MSPTPDEDDEPREYSSPACYLHEFDMKPITIYHNPRCTKSRETLALIEAAGIRPQVIEYLQTPPTTSELKSIAKKLGIKPIELVRKGEAIYKEKYAGKELSDAEWIAAMVADPILIERPIVVGDKGAVIGRPPEKVKTLIGR
jgi:arsenate reductase (glutaredoxin)